MMLLGLNIIRYVEWLELQIPEYRSLGDVVRLYRVVGVTSMDEIKVNEPGASILYLLAAQG